VLLDRHARGDFEDGFHAAESDVGENMAERAHSGPKYSDLDHFHVEIRRALAHQSPADIEAVVRRAWPILKYKALDDFDDSDDGDDLALRALLWIGKILRARDGVGNTWAPRRALVHCESALIAALDENLVDGGGRGGGEIAGTGGGGEVAGGAADADAEDAAAAPDCFALLDEVEDAIACSRRWLRPARKTPAAGCSAEAIVAKFSAAAAAAAAAAAESSSMTSMMKGAMSGVSNMLDGGDKDRDAAAKAAADEARLSHLVTIRTAALEMSGDDVAPRFFVRLRAEKPPMNKGEEKDDADDDSEGARGPVVESEGWTRLVEIPEVVAGGEVTVAVAGGRALPCGVAVAEARLTIDCSGKGARSEEVSWLVTRVNVTPLPHRVGGGGGSSTVTAPSSPLIQPLACSFPAVRLTLGGSEAPSHVPAGPTPPGFDFGPSTGVGVGTGGGGLGGGGGADVLGFGMTPVSPFHAPAGTVVNAVMRPRPWEACGAAAAARVAQLAAVARTALPLLTLAANVQNPGEGAARRLRERRRVGRMATEDHEYATLKRAREAEEAGDFVAAKEATAAAAKASAALNKYDEEDWEWLEANAAAAIREKEEATGSERERRRRKERAAAEDEEEKEREKEEERKWGDAAGVIKRAMHAVGPAVAAGVPSGILAAVGAAVISALSMSSTSATSLATASSASPAKSPSSDSSGAATPSAAAPGEDDSLAFEIAEAKRQVAEKRIEREREEALERLREAAAAETRGKAAELAAVLRNIDASSCAALFSRCSPALALPVLEALGSPHAGLIMAACSPAKAGLALSPRYCCASKHGSIDDSQYDPCTVVTNLPTPRE
jgi:hypothetical protein